MDYHKTSDMLALGLFMMLAGSVMSMLPGMLVYTVNMDLQCRITDDGMWIFEIGGIFTVIVLIRWAYRLAFGPFKDKCGKMDDMEKGEHGKTEE